MISHLSVGSVWDFIGKSTIWKEKSKFTVNKTYEHYPNPDNLGQHEYW